MQSQTLTEPSGPPAGPGYSEWANARRIGLTTLIGTVVIVAILNLGQEIFLPLAFAVLIAFALSPLVDVLRRRGAPTIVAVIAAVFVAFAIIGLFLAVVASQFAHLAGQLPTFQGNILTKLEDLRSSGSGNGIIARLVAMGAEIGERMSAATAAGGTAAAPMQVEVIERQNPVAMLTAVLAPLLGPVATAGLVVVVVIFILLERDDLRDRFIRLAGSNDIHKTTQVLSEAGNRVGQYLLTQLLVNTIYAVPIGLGLWLIGVPNALLWCLMTLVLRFVPYIGTFLSMAFPLLMAFAVSPGWALVLWTAALFLLVELVTSNVIEPWVYGSRTGVSPLAIIVAAIFWTWIWGPMGLVLSTPMTVCLVVLGRHLPQFEMFDILFGDRPPLESHSRLYQRLLVGDVADSTLRAHEALEDAWVADYHRDTGLPALLLAQADEERGVVSAEEQMRLGMAAMRFLDELEPVVADERAQMAAEGAAPAVARRVVAIGGHSVLDDVAARMLGQAVRADGAVALNLSHADLAPSRFEAVTGSAADTVVLGFLESAPLRPSLLHVRRIKRALPGARVGIVLWSPQADLRLLSETARQIGADFCVAGLDAALTEALADAAPLPLPEAVHKAPRRRLAAVAG